MAWTYSDYITLDGTSKLTRLRLHIREVSDAITAEVSGDGKSVASTNRQVYLTGLLAQEKELSTALGGRAGGVSYGQFKDAT